MTILGVALAGQGLLGEVEYEPKLPGGMVWLHVGLPTTLWLWRCGMGRFRPVRPRSAPVDAPRPPRAPAQRQPEVLRLRPGRPDAILSDRRTTPFVPGATPGEGHAEILAVDDDPTCGEMLTRSSFAKVIESSRSPTRRGDRRAGTESPD